MTLRPNYEVLMPSLLRRAPYASPELVREKMAVNVQLVLDIRHNMPGDQRAQLESFISGNRHILPSRFGLTDVLYTILRELCTEHPPDHAFEEAYSEFVHYFFHNDRMLGI